MTEHSVQNAPPLAGWTIAAGAGAVAFGVSLVPVGLDGNQAVAIGAVVALIVGIVFTVAGKPSRASGVVARATSPAPAAPAAPTAPEAQAEGVRPQGISAPVGGQADDLKRINGVGEVLEQKLNGLGIYHHSQIAAWSEDEAAWVDRFLDFKGRIAREGWIEQANALTAGEQGSD